MEFVNIQGAKTKLSKNSALVEYAPFHKKILGLLRGRLDVADNFEDDLPENILEAFEGKV